MSHGSTVNVCTLYLSKAFDLMDHYALLIKLMDRKLPINLLTVFEMWFRISVTFVKCNGYVSVFQSDCWHETRWSPVSVILCHLCRPVSQ